MLRIVFIELHAESRLEVDRNSVYNAVSRCESMLLRFRVANHRSIRDEMELSFVAADDSPYGRPTSGHDGVRSLPVVAVYGANASGKSAVLNALSFLSEAVSESHRGWDPDGGTSREPFMLDAASRLESSLFEVDLTVGDVRFAYGFELNDDAVTAEWIYAWPNGRKQVWLERDGSTFDFGRSLQGENRVIADFSRSNSLFLSVAAQNNHPQLMSLYRSLAYGIIAPRTPKLDSLEGALASTARALRDGRRDRVVQLIQLADLGIEDVIDLAAPTQMQLELPELFLDRRPPRGGSSASGAKGMSHSRPGSRSLTHWMSGASGRGAERTNVADLRFRHLGAEPRLLTVAQESAGTLSWFALVGQLLDVMGRGGVLCFDELDATLHPTLVAEVVSLFQDITTNAHGAQLFAACHDTTILSNATENHLRRDQVWLTEKNLDGATTIVPLSDYRVRADQNFELGYRQGRFGGVPIISAEHLSSALTPVIDAGKGERPRDGCQRGDRAVADR